MGLPAGTWQSDTVHSAIGFAVKHNVVSTFRGSVPAFDATLDGDAGTLAGSADATAIKSGDENLDGHLSSPEFFDVEKHRAISFSSSSMRADGDSVVVAGDLTIKGVTKPVELRGTLSGPGADAWGGERLGLVLQTTIDRTEFGIDWMMDIPGGGAVLGREVALTADLEFTKA